MQLAGPSLWVWALVLVMPFGSVGAVAAPCLSSVQAPPVGPAALHLVGAQDGRLRAAAGAGAAPVLLAPRGVVLPTRMAPVPGLWETAELTTQAVVTGRLLLPAVANPPDRYGATPVDGRLDSPTGPHLAEALVRAGAGYADPASLPDCRAALLEAERVAQAGRRGIWAVAGALARAEAGDAVRARVGTFAVVEGRVTGVRTFRGLTSLYFAPPGHTALTITVPAEPDATILRYGLDPAMLRGTLIRVRGIVREDGGPAIAVRLPGQMDALEERTR